MNNKKKIILVSLLLFLLLCITQRSNTYEHFYNKNINFNVPIKKDTIFISVASYRDSECPLTINDAFQKADQPSKIYVGICQQNNSSDLDCFNQSKYKKNIQIFRMSYKDAKGPTYARYICSTLWNGEEYYFQIDSHTIFTQGWDTKLKNLLRNTPGNPDKNVITHYPPSKDDDSNLLSYMCRSHFNNKNTLMFESALIKNEKNYKLVSPYLAAGMFFLKSDFLKKVPYDPELPFLFQGEEYLLSSRLWTNGYNFYMPSENIIKHHYTRQGQPKFWNDHSNWKDPQQNSMARAKYILGWIPLKEVPLKWRRNINNYGIGSVRSVEDFHKFTGVDYKTLSTSDYCNKRYLVNEKKWVPM